MKEFIRGLKLCFQFKGRDTRKQYWRFILVLALIYFIAGVLDRAFFAHTHIYQDIQMGPLYIIAILILLIPHMAIAARRLHDIGKSGWWQIIILIPIIGLAIIVRWLAKDSQKKANRFGQNPKDVQA